MVTIRNPFAGLGVGWTWAQHKANGYQGGTDYKMAAGKAITAPLTGKLTALGDGMNGFKIVPPTGNTYVVIREARSIDVPNGSQVTIGQRVATAGRKAGTVVKFPHIEGWVAGVRVPFEPLVHEEAAPVASGPKTRKTKATGKVNRRTGPGTTYPEVVGRKELPANTVGNFRAFAHGPASKGQPAATNVWYESAVYPGDWFWAGGFTTIDGSNLIDRTAEFADPVVTPPVVTPPVTTPPVTTPPVVTPPVVTPPVVTEPEKEEEVPAWFKRFLNVLIEAFKKFLG